ncbi:MAG: PilZ domain-containing protein [Hyphomicrobium sp.]
MSVSDRIAAITARAAASRVSAATDERRWALRKSSILSASIISDRLQGTVPCVIRDLSATGAKIALQAQRSSVIGSPSALPPTFKMLLDREQIEVDCELQWTSEREAGVRFLSSMRHLPQKPRKLPAPKNR